MRNVASGSGLRKGFGKPPMMERRSLQASPGRGVGVAKLHPRSRLCLFLMPRSGYSPQPATAWWCRSRDLAVASIRIRGELVMRGLRAQGIDAGWYHPEGNAPTTLVVSKRYDDATVKVIERLRGQGTRIVVDFCDNAFVASSGSASARARLHAATELARLADTVVASTQALAQAVQRHAPLIREAQVIGDLPDDLSVVPQPGWRVPLVRLKLAMQMRALGRARRQGRTLLLWFGHHGGGRAQSGYPDLARVLPLLDAVNPTRPLHLTVISDHRRRFAGLMRGHQVPARFFAWDAATFDVLASQHDIALIPATLNAYTSCKTDNRVVTALRAGLAVVADAVPSYATFGSSISLGDFQGGLMGYIDDPDLRAAHMRRGRELAASMGASAPIIRAWIRALQH